MHRLIALFFCLLVICQPAHAFKKTYDKVTDITEITTQEFIAKFNAWSGNSIFFRFVALQEGETDFKTFLVVRTHGTTELLEESEPVFLLIDGEKRVKLSPISAKGNEYGGMGTYWGFGISSYQRRVAQQLVYEVEPGLLQDLVNAKNTEGRIASAKFDIEGWESKEIKKVSDAINLLPEPDTLSKSEAPATGPSSP